MMTLLFSFMFAFSAVSAPEAGKDDLKVVDYDGLVEYLRQYEDKTVILNFWATWCVPCVKELPYFEQLTKEYAGQDVVVVLVSLDFSKQVDTRLKPFLKKHNLQSKVVLLDDPDQNVWIDKVDPSWSGAIPATVLKKGDRKEFYEKTFHSYDELNTLIQSFLKS